MSGGGGEYRAFSRKKQYELFYKYFEREDARYNAINNRAGAYLGFISIASYFGLGSIYNWQFGYFMLILFLATMLVFAAGLFFVAAGISICDYEEGCNINAFTDEIDENNWDEEDTYSKLLVNIALATDNNAKLNTQRAVNLQKSLICFLTVLVLAGSMFTYKIVSENYYGKERKAIESSAQEAVDQGAQEGGQEGSD
ncbi:MAG: hypothetical protein R3C45_08895 [Phycisphaerales bacterium]